jgi:hypothetical protein
MGTPFSVLAHTEDVKLQAIHRPTVRHDLFIPRFRHSYDLRQAGV